MASIKLDHDIKRLKRRLNSLGRKQLPFATSRAINNTAFDVRADEIDGMKRHLDQPSRYTVTGVRVKKGNKRAPTAVVGLDPTRGGYLRWVIEGGIRLPRRRAIAVPTRKNAKRYMNRKGDMKQGTVAALLAADLNPGGAGSGGPRKHARVDWFGTTFSGTPRNHPSAQPGIWMRTGHNGKDRLQQVMHWEPQTKHSKLLPWFETAKKSISRVFRGHLDEAIRSAIASAKRTA